METFQLQTSQNVSLEHPLASVGDRILATLLDFLVMGSYAILLTIIQNAAAFSNTFYWLLLPLLFYHLIFELFFNGQSPGKKIMGIRVLKADGGRLSPGACIIRWIFRLIEITISSGSLALATIILNGKGQRLGDLAAGTTVLKLPGKKMLEHSAWQEVEADYSPRFTQAELLNDGDIRTIREVLHHIAKSTKQLSNEELLRKTRQAIAEKTGINTDLGDLEFLHTVVKDYNALYQQAYAEV